MEGMKNMYLGCHLSASAGFSAMVKTAVSIGADTFAFFTRNPRGSRAKQENPQDAARAVELLRERHFGPLVAHGAYTMNLCTADPEARAFAADVLLETMAGKGSEIGGRFEELKQLLDAVGSSQVGVCLDTCHVYDGGYDIVKDLDGVLEEFDRVIGLNRLKALHLNDSKNPFHSHRDRHECIGQGSLGLGTFEAIVSHPALQELPMILETPNELPGYAGEIKTLRQLAANHHQV